MSPTLVVPNKSRHRDDAILFALMSTRNKVNRLNLLVHVRFCVARKPQLNLPYFVTLGSCPHILISSRLIVPNAKGFGNNQLLADPDFEILGIGKRNWNLNLGAGMGVLAKEQRKPLKNQ